MDEDRQSMGEARQSMGEARQSMDTSDLIQSILNYDCPILDISEREGMTSYIDFIEEREMGETTVMKGIDCFRRPFLVIKATVDLLASAAAPRASAAAPRASAAAPKNDYIHTFSTFFQRYSNDSLAWQCCGHYGFLLMATEGGMRHEQFKLLNQLLYEKSVTINAADISLVRLCCDSPVSVHL